MKRRTLLRTGGMALVGVVGTATTSGLAAAGDADPRPDDQEGRLPNETVETQQVDPLGGPTQSHEASVGSWIKHSLGWTADDCERARAVVENTRDVVHIDGERIKDTQRFWGECDPTGPRGASIEWAYYTPPKQPGTYDFSWKIVFTDDVGDNPEGRVIGPFSTPYEVLADRSRRGGSATAGGVTSSGAANADGGATTALPSDGPRPE